MLRPYYRFLPHVILSLGLAFTLAACSSAKKDGSGSLPGGGDATTEDAGASSDQGNAGGLQTVNFEYDNFSLSGRSKAILKENAKILKENNRWVIQIEGHCDERGGVQYNLALGDKRANSVRRYLQDLGVPKDRLNTLSFGKENPVAPGTSEEAYAKNRRANFVITSK